MERQITSSEQSGKVTIKLGKKFDFQSHKEFSKAYIGCSRKSEFIIDFARTTYMNSSALGMLLLLREFTGDGKHDRSISLVNCNKRIMSIVKVANFDRLFNIND